jgi:RNA polymerase sigma-70 factor (ECF subfamily)
MGSECWSMASHDGPRGDRSSDRLRLVSEPTPTDPRSGSDAEVLRVLMARVARGDEQAFAELYDAVSPLAFGVIRRVLRDPSQSEEVLQEVMVELWRTAARFDPDRGSVTAWLATLAHRRAVDRVRSEQSARQRTERDQQGAALVAPDVGEEVTETLHREVERQRVSRALSRLTDTQRQSIELAFYGGHTHAEVAQLLGLPLGTVKTRIRDGMIRLRDGLGAAS